MKLRSIILQLMLASSFASLNAMNQGQPDPRSFFRILLDGKESPVLKRWHCLFEGQKTITIICNEGKRCEDIPVVLIRQCQVFEKFLDDIGLLGEEVTEIPINLDYETMFSMAFLLKARATPRSFASPILKSPIEMFEETNREGVKFCIKLNCSVQEIERLRYAAWYLEVPDLLEILQELLTGK